MVTIRLHLGTSFNSTQTEIGFPHYDISTVISNCNVNRTVYPNVIYSLIYQNSDSFAYIRIVFYSGDSIVDNLDSHTASDGNSYNFCVFDYWVRNDRIITRDSNLSSSDRYLSTYITPSACTTLAILGDYDGDNTSYTVYDSSNDSLLFPQPPPQQEIVVEGTLAPIIQATETEKTMVEIVGILPLILVVLVSLVGLRKALAMLFHLLRKS